MKQFLRKVKLFVSGEKCYVYNNMFYEEKNRLAIQRLIVENCNGIVSKIGRPGVVKSVMEFIMREPAVYMEKTVNPTNLISFENGVLDTKSGILYQHSPEFYTMYGIKAKYLNTPYVSTPVFDRFLAEITEGDPELIERIWQMVGYILTPDTSAKVCFLLQGVPHSGKSALITLISKLISDNAVKALDVHAFGAEYSIGELLGKTLCISPDLPAKTLSEKMVSKVKQITGNDEVSSNVKYGSYVSFVCQARLIMATNHPLVTKTNDEAFRDRIVTIPFRYSVPKEKRDPWLISNLLEERDAIATKAIQAYYRLVMSNYRFSGNYDTNSIVSQGVEADESFKIFEFVQKNFITNPDAEVFTSDAFERYISLYGDMGIGEFSQYFS